jgi:hypothetical protein
LPEGHRPAATARDAAAETAQDAIIELGSY